MTTADIHRRGNLIVAAAMRGDVDTVHVLVHTVPAEQLPVVCETVIVACAELLQLFVPQHALDDGARSAQQAAHDIATERN